MSEAPNTRAALMAEMLKAELFNQGLHRAECKRFKQIYPQVSGLKLNLGCGPKVKEGWCNADLHSRDADFRLDLREDWPFATGSASVIYSEHFFEHLDYPVEMSHYLREALRVLEVGGVLHIGVPGTAWLMHSYGDPSSDYWRLAKTIWHPKSCQTQMHHINYHFRQEGEHKYAWDEETLIYEIRAHGFADPVLRDWDDALDSEDRRINTIYVMAYKPDKEDADSLRE